MPLLHLIGTPGVLQIELNSGELPGEVRPLGAHSLATHDECTARAKLTARVDARGDYAIASLWRRDAELSEVPRVHFSRLAQPAQDDSRRRIAGRRHYADATMKGKPPWLRRSIAQDGRVSRFIRLLARSAIHD